MTHIKMPTLNQIVILRVDNPMAVPLPAGLPEYPGISVKLKNPLALKGIRIAEVRVLEIDPYTHSVRVCFHAAQIIHPDTSTARAILLSYLGMRNTVFHVLGSLFRKLPGST